MADIVIPDGAELGKEGCIAFIKEYFKKQQGPGRPEIKDGTKKSDLAAQAKLVDAFEYYLYDPGLDRRYTLIEAAKKMSGATLEYKDMQPETIKNYYNRAMKKFGRHVLNCERARQIFLPFAPD